mmetsp:Transcript_5490/g.9551  ORF Transcript_5490/g.9551 Transcript_5490/m.9551 type:complete len:134 (+) Transcript_5490:14-415(+)
MAILVHFEGTNRHLLLAVKILLAVFIIFLLPQLVEGRRESAGWKRRRLIERKLAQEKLRCQQEVCPNLIHEESMDCIYHCLSPECYDQVYALSPLEEGEIDFNRSKDFEVCFKEQNRQARIKRRQQTMEAAKQ